MKKFLCFILLVSLGLIGCSTKEVYKITPKQELVKQEYTEFMDLNDQHKKAWLLVKKPEVIYDVLKMADRHYNARNMIALMEKQNNPESWAALSKYYFDEEKYLESKKYLYLLRQELNDAHVYVDFALAPWRSNTFVLKNLQRDEALVVENIKLNIKLGNQYFDAQNLPEAKNCWETVVANQKKYWYIDDVKKIGTQSVASFCLMLVKESAELAGNSQFFAANDKIDQILDLNHPGFTPDDVPNLKKIKLDYHAQGITNALQLDNPNFKKLAHASSQMVRYLEEEDQKERLYNLIESVYTKWINTTDVNQGDRLEEIKTAITLEYSSYSMMPYSFPEDRREKLLQLVTAKQGS